MDGREADADLKKPDALSKAIAEQSLFSRCETSFVLAHET